MAHKSEQMQESVVAEIQKEIQKQGCPDDIQQVKQYVKTLKKHSAFYGASKLLNLARDKQRTLRQQQENNQQVDGSEKV
ncbi:hypothetical protein [Nitrosomonas communis]|uniref:Uncharacterized protein n=1 Tax=Nitrosomonas communis TaxID=44574 RepID=A0A1H2QVY2_9PROT|nr:hypothetical protein [Nitrosomonas communis]SDW11327.1 hypothetical protein SAMN05421882_100346 [Nitrosomonas communis]